MPNSPNRTEPVSALERAEELLAKWPDEWKTDDNDRLGYRVFTHDIGDQSYSLIASVPSPFAAELIAMLPWLVEQVKAGQEAQEKLERAVEQSGAWQKRAQQLEDEMAEITRYLYGDERLEKMVANLSQGKPSTPRIVAGLVTTLAEAQEKLERLRSFASIACHAAELHGFINSTEAPMRDLRAAILEGTPE